MAKYCPYCVSPIEEGDRCTQCDYAQTYQGKSHHLRPGTLLNNKYLVGIVLGEGGFGITYQARDLALDMKVAIKEYFPAKLTVRSAEVSNFLSMNSTTAGDDFRSGKERVLLEAQTMARMDKESSVVTVRDFFEENNSAYIVMEFVEGKDLRKTVKISGKLAPDELFGLLKPVFGALNRLHAQGIIHRDISPDNIMIENGTARLIDFGGSLPACGDDASEPRVLKHSFSPPEQYENAQMGPRTDIYAMAATIYYCLTGQLPVNAMERVQKDTLKPPTALGAKLNSRQEKALMRALSLKAEDRFASMEEFGKALFVTRGREKWIVAAAAVVVALAAAAAVTIRPAAEVEVLEPSYHLSKTYTAEDGLTDGEKDALRRLEETAGKDIVFTAQGNSAHMEAVNTSGVDCTGVNLYIKYLDANGVIVGTSSVYRENWAAGESWKTEAYAYNISYEAVSVSVRFKQKDQQNWLQTRYCPAQLEQTEDSSGITLVNKLPCTLNYSSYSGKASVTITEVEITPDRQVRLIGKVTGGKSTSIYLQYKLYSESGAVVKTDTIYLPAMRAGDRFANERIYFYDLPDGKYRLELLEYKN